MSGDGVNMRIGMMADLYKPHISGVTNFISLNKCALEELGHEVFVFTFGHGDYQDDERNIIRSPGVPIFVRNLNLNIRYPRHARQVLQTMDVVHVHHPFISGPLALLYCRMRGIPVIFTSHTRYDIYSKAYVPVFGGIVKLLAMQLYLPIFTSFVDLVISPSMGMRQVLIKAGVKVQIDVVPNGVDLRPFRKPDRLMSRVDFGFSDADVLFIFVGRLGAEKNLLLLLESFYQAYLQNPGCGLILIGEGPLQDELKSWVADHGLASRVIFTGLVPYRELPGYLQMADVFATASVSEVHPLTLIESMAAGLPAIGIQSPGVGDTIQDGVTGLLCPQPAQENFCQAMVELMADPERRHSMGRQAQQASEHYAIEHTIEEMLKRYQWAIEKRTGKRAGRVSAESEAAER
jgi:glycosyltransferase involved in cell wall biosynthesis